MNIVTRVVNVIKDMIYEEPITIDRYRKCWGCGQGREFVIYDFGRYCGQGDYRRHVRCTVFPCSFSEGKPEEEE